MRRFLYIFKQSMHIMALMVALLVLCLYIVAHFNLAGIMVETNVREKLCEKLNARVEMGSVEVNWLNQIGINQMVIFDRNNDTLFCARRAMVAVEVVPLLQRKLVVNTVQLVDFQLFVSKDSLAAEPNYAFIIEALMPKTQNDQERHFLNDISLHSLFLRQGAIIYDVKDQSHSPHATLPDVNHLAFNDVSAVISLDINHRTGMELTLKRMKLHEKSGLTLLDFRGHASLSGEQLRAQNLSARLVKDLADGALAEIETHGELALTRDSLELYLQSIDLIADDWGDIHARTYLKTSRDSLKRMQYDAQFLPSRMERHAIEGIMSEFGLSWPMEFLPYAQQINTLRWDGALTGFASDSIDFQGKIATDGTLESKFTTRVSYTASANDPLQITLNGGIASAKIERHTYRNLTVDGSYRNRRISARFGSLDPLCRLNGQADVLLTDTATVVKANARVHDINPHALHLTEISNLDGLSFRGLVSTNFSLANAPSTHNKPSAKKGQISANDLPVGYVRIDSLVIVNDEEQVHLGPLRLTHQKEQAVSVFALVSPVANVVGTPTSIIGFVPSNPQFAHIMKFPGLLADDATFQAEWDTIGHKLTAEVNIPKWVSGEGTCHFHAKGQGTTSAESPYPTKFDADVNFEYNNPSHRLESALAITYEPEPLLVTMQPSTLAIDGKQFQTTDATLREGSDNNYILDNLRIVDKNQRLDVSGSFGEDEGLNMLVHMDNWQLDFFLGMLRKGYINFGGYASGDLFVTSQPSLLFQAQSLQVDSLTYIGTDLQEAQISFAFDAERARLHLLADIQSDTIHNSHVDCHVHLHEVHDTIDLRFNTDSLPIDFLHYWLGGALQDLHGHTKGDIRVFGDCDSLNIEGRPLLQNVNFTHEQLGGVRFYVTDTLSLVANADAPTGYVGLNNVTVTDRYGQKAVLTLDLEHKHFHELEYGVDIDIPETPAGFLVYDHPTQEDGALFWGRLWATGRCQMHGNYSHHRINLQMAPAGRSFFNLSPGEENFTENAYNFLTFRDKEQFRLAEENELERSIGHKTKTDEEAEEPTYVEMDLLIHANERCQVYVQMDPLAEDRLICKGNGDLSLHYDPFHDINLTGNYDITSGSYTVTMKGDVMTKAFQMQQGSRITFPGSPSEAELDLKAVYNIPSANLKDLDESFASVASLSRTTLPVDCKLNVTGQITAPQIAFDLEIKNTSDDVQALVHNIIGTQEMLNREVLYLLLFSKFYTPEYASTSQRQTGSELTSFASSSLTSQLNNLLGHMSDNFTLGTNFRSDKGDFSDMEMDVSVSTRLLNDRLLMTGNLGYRDPANSIGLNNTNNTFIGDFDMEFLINTRGTVRAKAYSHYNERDYSINSALTTQGIGIILRKDFKSFLEFIKRKQ